MKTVLSSLTFNFIPSFSLISSGSSEKKKWKRVYFQLRLSLNLFSQGLKFWETRRVVALGEARGRRGDFPSQKTRCMLDSYVEMKYWEIKYTSNSFQESSVWCRYCTFNYSYILLPAWNVYIVLIVNNFSKWKKTTAVLLNVVNAF